MTVDGVGLEGWKCLWRYPVPSWCIAGKLHHSVFVHFGFTCSSPCSSSVLRGRVRIHCQNLHSCKSNIILRLSAWGDRHGREDWLTPSLTQCLPCSRRNFPKAGPSSMGLNLPFKAFLRRVSEWKQLEPQNKALQTATSMKSLRGHTVLLGVGSMPQVREIANGD